MKKIEEIYINFSISSFGKIEMTKLSEITQKSHDVFRKGLLLNDNLENDKKLWESVKPLLREYENEEDGCIIIDDMLMYKPWTKVNDIVYWHYDHVEQRMQKGILMLNFHYTDKTGVSIPLGYEIITKTEEKWNEKYQKNIKKSLFTKNEIMRDKLELLNFNNEVKYKYILFDKWFASVDNLVFIEDQLNKKFVCPMKSNRRVALTLEEKTNGKYVNISMLDIEGVVVVWYILKDMKNLYELLNKLSKTAMMANLIIYI